MTEQEADDPDQSTEEHSANHDEDAEPTDEQPAGDAAEEAAGDATGEETAADDQAAEDEHTDSEGEDADSGSAEGKDEELTAGIELDVADELLEHVESTSTEELATEIGDLRLTVENQETDIEEYEARIDELESKLKRKQADFENYKKRKREQLEEEKARATEDLVERMVDVRDNLTRALEQDENADIRDGVETTLRQFDRVLEEENVTAIEPELGEEVDPNRHEVLVRMASEQPEGTIAEVHRPGYEMAEKVIRAAQVAVSEGED